MFLCVCVECLWWTHGKVHVVRFIELISLRKRRLVFQAKIWMFGWQVTKIRFFLCNSTQVPSRINSSSKEEYEPATGLESAVSGEQWDSWNLCMTLGRCMGADREGWLVCHNCYGLPQAGTLWASGHTTVEKAAAYNYEQPPRKRVYLTPKTRCNLSQRRSKGWPGIRPLFAWPRTWVICQRGIFEMDKAAGSV